ncbi:hypothetical protein BCR36DRAFT_584908 [Piromyces finnis]|uniref:Uncharacterized protein n=1 Tax=Piromyces finnis TaxID=1754191 RepID=A0A1Y1V4L6_9FUNG|nr:hypothetical protein BCR36DRAFT_584908 [Piromyces finnis]|eukprot:ORX47097.1 hypothetical protein BCR36DRAFT_584908 [Piromyces finnis]
MDEIDKLPRKSGKLDEEFYQFILEVHKKDSCKIKLNQLINIYDYLEAKNFKNIEKYVSSKANNELDEQQINILDEYFKKNNLFIKQKDYFYAIQKVISRYLISDEFKNYEWSIFNMLSYKPELWRKELTCTKENEEMFDNEISLLEAKLQEKGCDIKLGQSINFRLYCSKGILYNI